MVEPEAKDNQPGRLGGARADFVASLGRKVADARDVLGALEEDASAAHPRDELRRRLHALGTGARLLRFDSMARSLQEASAVLERAATAGTLAEGDLGFLAQVLDDLPALAWGEVPPRDARDDNKDGDKAREGDVAQQHLPFAVLIVGGEALAEALSEDAGSGRSFECERTEDAQAAIDLARAYAPDVVVVDAELDSAPELVEALLDDPLTEPVPIIVIGNFTSSEHAARFVALGVAKTLPKPVPAETLRRACEEVLDQRDGRTMRITLGEPTLEALGNRLAEEVRRALVESVDRPARSCRVPLGEGTEVLGAIWGAIARIQEVITAKSGGTIRFGGEAPEGAVALAPWLHTELPGADRMTGRGRGAAADVRLDRRRVVVADDDPGVTWFIADLLRTAGCEVHEALDGRTALDLAYKVSPELVVSDILMPGLDGFALCRALKRDVALRDTPVILLSWKEDLLQRVRELGASAAAYLRKESDSRAIVARVREVLRPRARIESRLRGSDEVRGRLDGITVRLLLELACTLRKNARVTVRDASFLYDVELRDGAPVRVTRTAGDGSFQRGERVLAALLGVGAGRFVVAPSAEPMKGELSGTLAEQLARPIAVARGALFATTGANTMQIERLGLDEVALADYLRATPEPARDILRRIASGTAPRQMILSGEVSPSLLEDVLADLAARGAISVVRGANGEDLLTPAIDAAYAILQGTVPDRVRPTLPPAARTSSAPAGSAVTRAPVEKVRSVPPASEAIAKEIASTYETFTVSEPPPPPPAAPDEDDDESGPSSLEDAVRREISGRTAEERVPSDRPPIISPSELRIRSSSPPALRGDDHEAVVPAMASHEEIPAVPRAALAATDDATEIDAPVEPREAPAETSGAIADEPRPIATLEHRGPAMEKTPLVAVATRDGREQDQAAAPPKKGRWGLLVALGIIGILVGAGLRYATPHSAPHDATITGQPSSTPDVPLATTAARPLDLSEIPPGSDVPQGKGLIDVTTSSTDAIRVDGEARGNGPRFSVALAPGAHDVRTTSGTREKTKVVEVRAGKSTRVDLTDTP
jgi:DNA-binding response OmpR family regulator